MDRYLHWINGARTAPASGDYLPTLDPMTTQPWAEIARGDAVDVEAAVQAAQAAFAGWRNAGPTRGESAHHVATTIDVQHPTPVEHVDESANLAGRTRDANQKMSRHPDSHQRHARTSGDLDHQHRQRDRNPASPVDDPVEA